MKTTAIALFIVLITMAGYAQDSTKDSLFAVWEDTAQPDLRRVYAFASFIEDYSMNTQPEEAIKQAAELLYFAENISNNPHTRALSMGRSSFILARLHYRSGRVLQSLSFYKKTIHALEKTGELEYLGYSYNNLGLIYRDLKDFSTALNYYKEAHNLFVSFGASNLSLSKVLRNIGDVYKELGNDTAAKEYYLKAFEYSYHAAINLGNLYRSQGDLEMAFKYYDDAFEYFHSFGDSGGTIQRIYLEYGKTFLIKEDYEKGRYNCQTAYDLYNNRSEFKILEYDICECLYQAERALGSTERALDFMERMKQIEKERQPEEVAKELQLIKYRNEVYADSVAQAEEDRLVAEAHQAEIEHRNRVRNIAIGSGLLALLLAGGFYSRWRYVRKANSALAEEKERSENLLLNILPEDIAKELKETGKAEAREFEMVSILFTDFKAFTSTSEKMSAQDLVAHINECFEAFDVIIAKYGIEKIKTIGDAYMAAGGLPVPRNDSVRDTVLAALEMQEFIEDLRRKRIADGKQAFEMRLGIHTGPVVAGIVGIKKFQYDIWGDTVNTASRMESAGEIGKVNISQTTYDQIKDDPQFHFEHRGKVEAKGKGEVDMWFVIRQA